MRQTEINNGVILLRKSVRQARICIISKLIREAKMLQHGQHGNEKQLDRKKNKADKLLREVFALKRIKDDEISKFGIINLENLQDVLKDPQIDDGMRAMVKIVRYKCLNERISEFREKFPDYKEYISPGKRKHSSKRKGSWPVDDFPEENRKRGRNERKNDIKVSARKENTKSRTQGVGSMESLQCTTRQQSKRINEQLKKLALEEAPREKLEGYDGKSCNLGKVISKEASVKRFAEVLEETDGKREQSDEHEKDRNQQYWNDGAESRRRRTDEFFLNTDEANSSITVLAAIESKKERIFEVDDRASKVVCIKSKEDKFSVDKREMGGKGINGRKEKMNDKDVSDGQNNVRRKTNVRDSKENKDIPVKKTSLKRNEGHTSNCKSEEKELHPSWVARRKQQEIMKQGFQGKKIKFDED